MDSTKSGIETKLNSNVTCLPTTEQPALMSSLGTKVTNSTQSNITANDLSFTNRAVLEHKKNSSARIFEFFNSTESISEEAQMCGSSDFLHNPNFGNDNVLSTITNTQLLNSTVDKLCLAQLSSIFSDIVLIVCELMLVISLVIWLSKISTKVNNNLSRLLN
jgi:hypothetical protein